MAGRIKWHSLLRTIHFYSASVTAVFLLMYFITGFLMVRAKWFEGKPEIIKETIYMDLPDIDQENLSEYLKDTLKLKGKTNYRLTNDGQQVFEYNSLSTFVIIHKAGNTLLIEKRNKSPLQVITTFHRLHGYGGGALYSIYIFMMDLVSFALILFSITGIFLWLKALTSWKWGLLMFCLGLGYTIWVVLTLFI